MEINLFNLGTSINKAYLKVELSWFQIGIFKRTMFIGQFKTNFLNELPTIKKSYEKNTV